MRRINLLPWRADRRREHQHRFLRHTAGVLAAALGLLALVTLQESGRLDEQQRRNAFLQAQVQQYNQGTVTGGAAAQSLLRHLQRQRALSAHYLEALARATPEGVVLTELRQRGKVLEVSGRAQSNAQVSSFLRGLAQSPWFTAARLGVIRSGTGEQAESRFVLEVDLATAGEG